jgi:hypothetical protein
VKLYGDFLIALAGYSYSSQFDSGRPTKQQKEKEMSKLTDIQLSALKLIERSPDHDDGWRKCSPIIYSHLDKCLTPDLFESKRDEDNIFVRLTDEAATILKWL